MTAEKLTPGAGTSAGRPPLALNNHRHKYKETRSSLILYRNLVLSFNPMFSYFRYIVVVHVDERMGRTACTPHTLHLGRTRLHRV